MIPVVWKGRLYLFWLRILKQAPQTAQKPGAGDVNLTSLKTSDIKTRRDQTHRTGGAVVERALQWQVATDQNFGHQQADDAWRLRYYRNERL